MAIPCFRLLRSMDEPLILLFFCNYCLAKGISTRSLCHSPNTLGVDVLKTLAESHVNRLVNPWLVARRSNAVKKWWYTQASNSSVSTVVSRHHLLLVKLDIMHGLAQIKSQDLFFLTKQRAMQERNGPSTKHTLSAVSRTVYGTLTPTISHGRWPCLSSHSYGITHKRKGRSWILGACWACTLNKFQKFQNSKTVPLYLHLHQYSSRATNCNVELE